MTFWRRRAHRADREIEFAYDLLGRLFTSNDVDHESIHVYERRDLDVATTVLGGVLTGLETAFWFYNEYDAVGNRTYAQVSMDGVDFVNTYAYDNLHRLTSVVQSDEGYTAVVTDKRVDFTYDLAGQLDTIKRYASTSTASPVAVTDYDYDFSGRVTEIDHRSGSNPAGGTQLAGYGYAWNERSQLTAIDFLPSAYNGEDVTYDYDNRHQLEGANYTTQADETYAYDDNGNRNNGGFTVGSNNRLLDDGTYDYQYDNEGNRTKRIHQTTYDSTVYVWDHRNRLVEVRDYDGNNTASTGDDTLVQEVDYAYDADNQIVKRVVDVAGASPIEQTFYVWENGQILLQFDKTGPGDLSYQDLSHRYLWGPLVDQLLADEQVDWTDSDPDGEVLWALTDHLGTVRDIVNNSATVVDHAEYSAFGKRLDPAAVDVVFEFTGKLFDEATGLQNNHRRWYDAAVGEWASEDFIWDGTNPHAYVGNEPTKYVDPSGLQGDLPPMWPVQGIWTGTPGHSWHKLTPDSTPVLWFNGTPDFSSVPGAVYSRDKVSADFEIELDGSPIDCQDRAALEKEIQKRRNADFAKADEEMRRRLKDSDWRRPPNYTWHHFDEHGRMQLVPRDLHEKTFPHRGGVNYHLRNLVRLGQVRIGGVKAQIKGGVITAGLSIVAVLASGGNDGDFIDCFNPIAGGGNAWAMEPPKLPVMPSDEWWNAAAAYQAVKEQNQRLMQQWYSIRESLPDDHPDKFNRFYLPPGFQLILPPRPPGFNY